MELICEPTNVKAYTATNDEVSTMKKLAVSDIFSDKLTIAKEVVYLAKSLVYERKAQQKLKKLKLPKKYNQQVCIGLTTAFITGYCIYVLSRSEVIQSIDDKAEAQSTYSSIVHDIFIEFSKECPKDMSLEEYDNLYKSVLKPIGDDIQASISDINIIWGENKLGGILGLVLRRVFEIQTFSDLDLTDNHTQIWKIRDYFEFMKVSIYFDGIFKGIAKEGPLLDTKHI